MNRENSVYTIIYASILVIIVALTLAFTHQSLSKKQTLNVNIDKMQQILRSINVEASSDEAEAKYREFIQDAFLVDREGNRVEGTEGIEPEDPAFSTAAGDESAPGLPVFEAVVDGESKYILPMNGSGLWGAIWGYIAVSSDGSTVYGIDFGHASETPGLGAEIVESEFKNQFADKQLFRENSFTSIAVVKVGGEDRHRDYVDGISGGTITSNGVDAMLYNSIGNYENFLLKIE